VGLLATGPGRGRLGGGSGEARAGEGSSHRVGFSEMPVIFSGLDTEKCVDMDANCCSLRSVSRQMAISATAFGLSLQGHMPGDELAPGAPGQGPAAGRPPAT